MPGSKSSAIGLHGSHAISLIPILDCRIALSYWSLMCGKSPVYSLSIRIKGPAGYFDHLLHHVPQYGIAARILDAHRVSLKDLPSGCRPLSVERPRSPSPTTLAHQNSQHNRAITSHDTSVAATLQPSAQQYVPGMEILPHSDTQFSSLR